MVVVDPDGPPAPRPWTRNARSLGALLILFNLALLLHGALVARAAVVAFLLLIPGVVLLAPTPLRPRETCVRFAWSVGVSIVFLMLLGLAYSEILPHLGLNRPLTEWPLVVGVDGFLLLAGGLQLRRRDPLSYLFNRFDRTFDAQFGLRDIALGLLLLSLPVLSALGAERLNNGDNGDLAMLTLVLVGGVIAMTFLLPSKLPEWFTAGALYFATAAILLSFSMRTDFTYGYDIQTEFQVATSTLHAGVWHVPTDRSAYASMLSITILPTVLSATSHMTITYLMKSTYPLIFASFPMLTYIIASRWYMKRAAMIGAIVVIVQGLYAADITGISRQEVGLLFFGLFCVTAFDRVLSRRVRQFALVFVVAAMSISHYSTAYFTMIILILGFATFSMLRLLNWRQHPRAVLSLPVLVLMIAPVLLWNVTITRSAQQVGNLVSSLDTDGLQILAGAPGQSLVSRILNSDVGQTSSTTTAFEQNAAAYVKHDLTYIHPYPASVTSKYPIAAGTVTTAVRHVPAIAGKVISNGQAVLNELVLLLLAIGVITLLLRERTLKAPERAELAAFALGCAVLLAVLRFSGTISQLYNAPRGQVQGAPLLGVATALVATWLFERRHAGVIYVAGFAGALSLMLFADSGFADFALTGKGVDTISNSGEAYQENDITAADVASAEWVVAHHRPKGVITYTDVYGELQIYRYSHLDGVVTAITPDVLEPNSWIYATSTNIVYDTVRDAVGDGQVTTKLPTAFLNRETNLVFTTGTTRIYY